ncbi:D site albumin promoter binding protein a [Cynoglossus semilaevis]|uniref:D site albumin promoter binding protein a n=1 Tax=Cynoglossus semilaevis TaxID=244447 RepID=UPI000497DB39|nr:thyrotroph embryonic factor-like [Cynoglossus semilaevis]
MSRPLTQLLPADLSVGGTTESGPQVTSMNNLKTLLQLPVKSDQEGSKDCCQVKDKHVSCDVVDHPLAVNAAGLAGVPGSSGPTRPHSQSAFLGPLLWERTLPCEGGLFQLQYMDLEEFLMENAVGGGGGGFGSTQIPSQNSQPVVPSQSSQCPPTSPSPCSSSSSSKSSSSSSLLGLEAVQPPPVLQREQDLMGGAACLSGAGGGEGSSDIQVNFDPDPADLALSSVPGQEAFDPRNHCFSEEELKPQPMIKKARKIVVPEEQKDDKYWNRRVKNNEAAKRSRDARRLKENQISVRAAFLERENAVLRQEVADMRKELGRCRNVINKYESCHGDL